MVIKFVILINRIQLGFDVFDEGFLMLMLKYPEEYNNQIFLYHKIWTSIFPSFIEVVKLRYLKILFEVIFASIFAISAHQYFKRAFISVKIPSLLFTLLFTFLAIGINVIERVYSYSSMNYSLVLLALSGFLLIPHQKRKTISYIGAIICGFTIGFDIYFKLSTAIILLFCFAIYFLQSKKYKQLIITIISLLVSFLIVSISFYGSLSDWFNSFLNGLNNSKLEGYGSVTFYMYYLLNPIYQVVSLFIIPICILLVLKWYAKRYQSERLNRIAYTVSIIVSIFIFFFSNAVYLVNEMAVGKPFIYYLPQLLPFVLIISLLFFSREIQSKIICSDKLVLLVLVVSPFITFFGSMGAFEEGLLAYGLPMITVLLVVLVNLKRYYKNVGVASIVFVFFVSTLYFDKYFPIRNLAPFFEHTETLSIGNEEIILDSTTSTFFKEVKKALVENDVEDNQYFLALCNLPGLVYYTGNKSPLVPLYLDFPMKPEMNKHNLNHNKKFVSQLENREDIKIVAINEDLDKDLKQLLFRTLNIENSYKHIATVFNPYQRKLYIEPKDTIMLNLYVRN